jgi:hypothetical protein
MKLSIKLVNFLYKLVGIDLHDLAKELEKGDVEFNDRQRKRISNALDDSRKLLEDAKALTARMQKLLDDTKRNG